MGLFQKIRTWWWHKIVPLKQQSTRMSDEELQVIKTSHGIKKLFFEKYQDEVCYSQQNGKQRNNSNLIVKGLRITKVAPHVFFENISFWNVDFTGVVLEDVCFHNCVFNFCNFDNMTTHAEKQLIDIHAPRQVFSCCDFLACTFSNCHLTQLFFSIGALKAVKFIDTNLDNVVFQMNSFSQIYFEHNCDLRATYIFSPSGMFDIQFREKGGSISIDDKSTITAFRYKDKFNIHDRKTYRIFKSDHYKNVADTYYAFERLMNENRLFDKKSNCFYQRKRAETRSKTFWRAIPGYFAEWCFGYGEYPARSLFSLFVLVLFYAPLYMLSGFCTGTRVIDYALSCDFSITWETLRDFCESIYFSFFTLITVGQGSSSPMFAVTKILSATELLIGAILITTFTATLFRKITE